MQNPTGNPAAPVRPEDVLADDQNVTRIDGLDLRKGTVAAFLQNAMRWTASPAGDAQREALQQELFKALPALRALGVFNVFDIRDDGLRDLLNRHGNA